MTLSRYIFKLLEDQHLNAAEISRRTGLHPGNFSRLKSGHRLKLGSLLAILTKGLGFTQHDHQYLEAMSLWMADSKGADNSRLALRISSAESTRDKTAEKLLQQIAKLINGMNAEERADLLEATKNPEAIKLWLASARALRGK